MKRTLALHNLKVKSTKSKLLFKFPHTIFIVLFITILNISASAQGNLPFDPRTCILNCTANDVEVTAAQLYADAAGTTPLASTCTPGTNVTAYLGITFRNNSNANRGVIALAADVYINGTFSSELKYCPSLALLGNQTKVFVIPTAITWVCGESIELKNILGGWDTGNAPYTCPTKCKDIIASKCGSSLNITVTTPPTALFTFACTANAAADRSITFTNSSTGGPANSLTYVWNFGDGSPTLTTSSPTHIFTGDGPFNVTLTITNNVGTDMEIKAVIPKDCKGLPVRLISFTGKVIATGNKLKWETTSEVNFSHFEIEKSIDASKYSKIGLVLGNHSEVYNFVDTIANQVGKPIAYYRLKMIDLDGSFEYSKALALHNNDVNTAIGLLFPNPSYASSRVEILVIIASTWSVNIFDQQGKLTHVQIMYLPKGHNVIEISQLTKGINFVQFSNGQETQIRKVFRN